SPLATRVIGELIGLPPSDALELGGLVAAHFERRPGQVGTSTENEGARVELLKRLDEGVSSRADHGDRAGGDPLAVLLHAQAEGRPLGRDAVLAALYTLLVTGAEVLPLAVANCVYYLWQHPDQRREVVQRPERVPHAFAEALRYDQPTNLLG